MISSFREFWQGRLLIRASGANLARLINEGVRDGIVFFKTQKSESELRAQIKVKDFARLRRAARATRSRIRIQARYGWPFVAARWWRRKGLLGGMLLIGSTLLYLSQMILSISVTGNTTISSEEIFVNAEKLGLKTWIRQKDVDLNEVGRALVEQFPDAAWIGIERQGTHVEIKLVQKIRPQVPSEAGNLVAAKAGLVQQLMVIQGTPLIHEGEMVKAGQVLIKAPGRVENLDGSRQGAKNKPNKAVVPESAPAAKGFARGRVWYSSEASVPLSEDILEESGREADAYGIKIASRVIMVTSAQSPFKQAQQEEKNHSLPKWRNWSFPVELVSIHYKEMRIRHSERTPAEARKQAEDKARDDLRQKLSPGAVVVGETVRSLAQNGSTERVRVELETFEDLAVYPK